MDFGTLKSRILAIIGRAPADMVYEMVTADINQRLRVHQMESTTTLTEAASITLPTDFLEVVSIYRDTDPRRALKPLPAMAMQRTYESSGTPTYYSIVDGTMLLSPSPDGSESLELRYIAKLTDLSADSDENDILTDYPSIYVYGALAHHSALIRDVEAAGAYYAAYERAIAQAEAEDKHYRMGGLPMTPVVRTAP